MTSNSAGSGELSGAGARVHGHWLADDEAICEQLADRLTGVGVGDLVDLIWVEPDLALSGTSDGGRQALLGAEVDPTGAIVSVQESFETAFCRCVRRAFLEAGGARWWRRSGSVQVYCTHSWPYLHLDVAGWWMVGVGARAVVAEVKRSASRVSTQPISSARGLAWIFPQMPQALACSSSTVSIPLRTT